MNSFIKYIISSFILKSLMYNNKQGMKLKNYTPVCLCGVMILIFLASIHSEEHGLEG